MNSTLTLSKEKETVQFNNDIFKNLTILKEHINYLLSLSLEKEKLIGKIELITISIDERSMYEDKGIFLADKSTNYVSTFHCRDIQYFLKSYKNVIIDNIKKHNNLRSVGFLTIESVDDFIDHSEYVDECREFIKDNIECTEWRTIKGQSISISKMDTLHIERCITRVTRKKDEMSLWKLRGFKKELFLRNLKH